MLSRILAEEKVPTCKKYTPGARQLAEQVLGIQMKRRLIDEAFRHTSRMLEDAWNAGAMHL
jgi:hypothetical protein